MSKLTFTISMTLALVIGVVIGIGWMSISHEGLDGEYFRALKTVGGSGVNWIDAIFRYCVVLLVNMAKVIGILHEALNIWVFIIVQPLIIFLLFVWVIRLRRKVKNVR